MSSVVVVGAGIVGASVAYHLACLGVPVTLIDRASSPAEGVTGGSFGWIDDGEGDWPGGADDLRASALVDYRRLEGEVSGVAVRWTGSLAWTNSSVRDRENPALRPGQPWIGGAEIQALEPHLRNPPDRAVHSPTAGGVDAAGVTRALVQAARKLGAHLVLDSDVTSLRVVRGRVEGVLSAAAFHSATTVVLAAGTGVVALSDQLGFRLPVASSPAFLMHVAAPTGLVKTIVVTPDFEVRELRDGHLLMTVPLDSERSKAALQRLAEQTLERLQATFSGDGSFRLLEWRLSDRPMPAKGPLVGYLTPDRTTYLAVMHSAVTLAPTVGRLVAQELATGERAAELQRCHP